ncbi:hypothetical protein F66182_15992, partial [Fusarium sp. NRRL 66182]
MQSGISSGNPHQVAHNVQDALKKDQESKNKEARRQRKQKFLPLVGGGITNAVGNGATVFEKKVVGGLRKANQGVGQRLENTPGFAVLPEEPASTSSRGNRKEINDPRNRHDRSSFDSNKDSVNSVPEEIDQQAGYEVSSEEQTSHRPGWSRKSSANSKRGNRLPEADEIPLTEVETRESQIRPDTSTTNDSVPQEKKDGQEYPL